MTNFSKDTRIAFLGMGLMGSRMAKRLIDAGFSVAVWNRSPQACDPLIAHGAELLEVQEVQHYPIIMLCLADDHAVHQVFTHIQPYLAEGQICIDFSSLSVQATLDLSQQANTKHVEWIDAPVSGGVMGAEQGTLVIFAGGNPIIIEKLSPIFTPLSQRVTCMGKVGTGQATKICNQLIVAATSTLIAEAVALAEHAGVDATLLAPALAGGFADSKPFQILAPRMATKTFEPVQWKVQTLSKDLNNAAKLAEQIGVSLPVASYALQHLQHHQQQGFSEQDLSTVILNVPSSSNS